MINSNFDYDKTHDVTHIWMEYNGFEWTGSHKGELPMFDRHGMVTEFIGLCLKEGMMSHLDYVGLKRIFSINKVDGVHILGEECDGAFEIEVDKKFVLKLAEELKQYAEEKM